LACETGEFNKTQTEYKLQILPNKVDELIKVKLYKGDVIAFSGNGFMNEHHSTNSGGLGSLNWIVDTNFIKVIKESK
jgi:hypothetical protein